MKDWEEAEKIVKTLTGGKFTPASGAKKVKGDVRFEDWMLEVKQTSKTVLTLQHLWLEKLEKYKTKCELALVIFFQLRGYVYYYQGNNTVTEEKWKTVQLLEDKLPSEIYSKTGIWKLEPISTLATLNE